MGIAIAFIQWESYSRGPNGAGFLACDSLTFNSNQERLLALSPGDLLFLVSRHPDDRQYYFVCILHITGSKRNPKSSDLAQKYGEFAVVADRNRSYDLNCSFAAEGLLRAFQFDRNKPIKHGGKIGQALQTLQFLDENDERILKFALADNLRGPSSVMDEPFGLWTKCDRVFADYFLSNWEQRKEPLSFLLYDSAPVLPTGAPIFIHSDKCLRLIATFRHSEFIAGHKKTVEKHERVLERERIWKTYREHTLDPPSKSEFDEFWEKQNGVRAHFIMDNVVALPSLMPFSIYGQALEWGYPLSVGHRYLSLSQSALLLRGSGLPENVVSVYLSFLDNRYMSRNISPLARNAQSVSRLDLESFSAPDVESSQY